MLEEWDGWCAQDTVTNIAISAPKLADILAIYLRLDWLDVQLVFIILLV